MSFSDFTKSVVHRLHATAGRERPTVSAAQAAGRPRTRPQGMGRGLGMRSLLLAGIVAVTSTVAVASIPSPGWVLLAVGAPMVVCMVLARSPLDRAVGSYAPAGVLGTVRSVNSLTRTVAVSAVSLSLLGSAVAVPAASAAASWEPVSVDSALDSLYEAYDVSDALAESTGGYRYQRTSSFRDGGSTITDARFWTDSSVEFHEHYSFPTAPSMNSSVEYVWDAEARTFAFPPVTQRTFDAYQLLGADPKAWLAQKMSSFYGDSMATWLGRPSAQAELIFLETHPTAAKWDASGRILRFSCADRSSSEESTVDVYLDDRGAIETVYWAAPTLELTTSLTYTRPSIEVPSSPTPVRWKDYLRAVQTMDMPAVLSELSTRVVNHPDVLQGKGLRPGKVAGVVRRAVERARVDDDFVIPVRIKRTKSGARLTARNVFSGEKTTLTFMLIKPYPSRSIGVSWGSLLGRDG